MGRIAVGCVGVRGVLEYAYVGCGGSKGYVGLLGQNVIIRGALSGTFQKP